MAAKKKNKWLCLVLSAALALSAGGCSFGSLNEKETNTEDTQTENTGKDTSSDETDISSETKEPVDTENLLLYDYAKENTNNSLVYEGYTVEYEVSGFDDDTYDLHIHLPKISDKSPASEKWNSDIAKKYSTEYDDQLRRTAEGKNDNFFANVTWESITTGDVVTVSISNSRGIMYSDAFASSYDIYHYDTINKKFLTTNEFLAYYAECEFAGYTLSDILEVMNKTCYTAGEEGDIAPLTEKDIYGVIPSVLGNGSFDVVYQGYTAGPSVAGYTGRILFRDYPIHTSKDSRTDAMISYTYHYVYSGSKNCMCKASDDHKGYNLMLIQYPEGARADERKDHIEDLILTEYINFNIERSTDGNVYLYSNNTGVLQKIPFENYNQ